MEKLTGIVEVRLSVAAITHINELIEKDKSKPVKSEVIGESTIERCPNCDRIIFTRTAFCDRCGQRLDFENTEL